MILCVASEISGGQAILKQRLPQPQHKLIVIFNASRGLYQFAFQWNMPIKSSSSVCLLIHRQLLPLQGTSNIMFAWYFVKRCCRLLRKNSPKHGKKSVTNLHDDAKKSGVSLSIYISRAPNSTAAFSKTGNGWDSLKIPNLFEKTFLFETNLDDTFHQV